MVDFQHYQAVSFDCYGTLIDWNTGIATWAEAWLAQVAPGSEVTPAQFLAAFSRHERTIEREQPTLRYPLVLAEVLRRIGTEFGLPVSEPDATSFGASVGDWPAFDDSTQALRALAERFKLVVLSNVDRSSFARSQERLAVRFDAIITAEDVGAYKPDPANFDTLLATVDGMGVPRHALLHVGESIYHDVNPAIRDRIDCIWIDRSADTGGPTASGNPPTPSVLPIATYPSMAAFTRAALNGDHS